jgi:hypothetical protein
MREVLDHLIRQPVGPTEQLCCSADRSEHAGDGSPGAGGSAGVDHQTISLVAAASGTNAD